MTDRRMLEGLTLPEGVHVQLRFDDDFFTGDRVVVSLVRGIGKDCEFAHDDVDVAPFVGGDVGGFIAAVRAKVLTLALRFRKPKKIPLRFRPARSRPNIWKPAKAKP